MCKDKESFKYALCMDVFLFWFIVSGVVLIVFAYSGLSDSAWSDRFVKSVNSVFLLKLSMLYESAEYLKYMKFVINFLFVISPIVFISFVFCLNNRWEKFISSISNRWTKFQFNGITLGLLVIFCGVVLVEFWGLSLDTSSSVWVSGGIVGWLSYNSPLFFTIWNSLALYTCLYLVAIRILCSIKNGSKHISFKT